MIILLCGTVKAIYAWLFVLVMIQTLNGWVQGMGWPPCGKTMVHWFSTKERGLTVSFWNVSHNIGGALIANFALLGVTLFNDWGAKFYFNALIAARPRGGRVCAPSRHSAVGRPAAGGGVPPRLPRPTTAPTMSGP